VILITSPNTSW